MTTPPQLLSLASSFRQVPGLGAELPVVLIAKAEAGGSYRRARYRRQRETIRRGEVFREMRRSLDGFIRFGPLGALLAGERPHRLDQVGLEPYEFVSRGPHGLMAFHDQTAIRRVDLRTGEVLETFDRAVSRGRTLGLYNVHTLDFHPTDDERVLVAVTGLDRIVELHLPSGEATWEWCPWEHGMHTNAHGVTLVEKGQPPPRLVGEPRIEPVDFETAQQRVESGVTPEPGTVWLHEVDLLDVPARLGLLTWQRVKLLNSAYYAEGGAKVMVTFWQTGEAVEVDRQTGEVSLVAEGLVCPHSLIAAGDGNLLTDTGGGRVLRFENRPDVERADVFLDIGDRVRQQHNEEGLLGLAFHPDYARSGHVYAYYSASGPRRTQISRFSARGGRADPSDEHEVLRIEQPYGNHNGGWIAFGPDGHLYAGIGDGGAAGDPEGNGQDVGTLLGSILRLRVGPGIDGYAIPQDNPFVGTAGARPEIWAFGLRNPWRCSFDRQAGALWCGDVGQDQIEEIDVIEAGGNYGWNLREGTHRYRRGEPSGPLVEPVVEYGHDQGQSVTGGYVYRGTRLADFRGMYVYGDFVTGVVWAIDVAEGEVRSHARVASVPGLASFGEDAAGELYAASFDGRLHRFEPGDADVAGRRFPTLLSQTGLFVDTAGLVPSAGLLPYDVTVPLWSDAATKRRWLFVPPDQVVGYDPQAQWSFPVGTVAVKHFERASAPGSPPRRLETRVMIHERRGWAGYTYRWNDAQTDAELVTTPQTLKHHTPGPGRQRWTYPAGSDCLRCHTPGYGQALGLRTRQLAGTAEGRALVATLVERDQLSPPPDLEGLTAHPRLDDEATPVSDRARAYLDVNCAPCHHPGGPAPGGVDLRVGTALADAALLGVVPEDRLGLPGELRLAPGERSRSALWQRMGRRGERGQMPPLASLRVDEDGRALIGRWIDGLGQAPTRAPR
ncbi:MAG: PQQ-dependent sugar dehydrogenase [Myxococcales bacterium]|nr:PQQ-dependent sugar dehydrogenase [Myxococcales bacterium]